MWGILYSFILFFYRVLLVLVLGCVVYQKKKKKSIRLCNSFFVTQYDPFFFLIIIRSASFPYDSYFPMSTPFPYYSYFLMAVGFASSEQLQPNVFCVGGHVWYMYHISTKKIWKFRGGTYPPCPPPPPSTSVSRVSREKALLASYSRNTTVSILSWLFAFQLCARYMHHFAGCLVAIYLRKLFSLQFALVFTFSFSHITLTIKSHNKYRVQKIE